jgi:hypothetical protein
VSLRRPERVLQRLDTLTALALVRPTPEEIYMDLMIVFSLFLKHDPPDTYVLSNSSRSYLADSA